MRWKQVTVLQGAILRQRENVSAPTVYVNSGQRIGYRLDGKLLGSEVDGTRDWHVVRVAGRIGVCHASGIRES